MTTILTLIILLAAFLAAMHLWTRRLSQRGMEAVPQSGRIVPVRGGSIHYVEGGDPARQTIVLIHGLSGQLQHFTYALMDKLTDEYHVIAVDRPGCGYSTRDDAGLGKLPDQARMIQEFLDARNVTDPVLVGHSLGGAVALAMALDNPDKISGLALLAPLTQVMPAPPAAFKPLEIRTGWLRNLIGNTIAVPLAAKTASRVLDAVFDPEPAPSDFLYRAGGALVLRPSAFITASQDLVGVDDSIAAQCDRYPDLKVSGGILFGAQDEILSAAQHGASMTQFGMTYEELDGYGHMILITIPDTCAAFIRRITASCSTPGNQVNAVHSDNA